MKDTRLELSDLAGVNEARERLNRGGGGLAPMRMAAATVVGKS